MRKITSLFLIVLLAAGCLSSCGRTESFEPENTKADEDKNQSAPQLHFDEVSEIARSGGMILSFDPRRTAFDLLEEQTGTPLWSTGVSADYYGKEIKNKIIEKGLRQLIAIWYTDFDKRDDTVNNLDDNCETTIRKIENGLRLDFTFTKIFISLSLEISLTDGVLGVKIPAQSIKEEGIYGLVSIDVLPMLGAAKTEETGYFFYPDGPGAIWNFGTDMGSSKTLSMNVYGKTPSDIAEYYNQVKQGVRQVTMPVFGINKGNRGLFANITRLEENCAIVLAADGHIYEINRIYPSLRIRERYTVKAANNEEISTYQRDNTCGDLAIQYTPFAGEECGYSAMADIYRTALTKTGALTKQKETSGVPVAVDFLVNVKKESMVGYSDITMTSFDAANEILKTLADKGVVSVESILYGWQSEGYNVYPTGGKAASGAGGKGALETLSKNAEIYLLGNYFEAGRDQNGYSKQSDIVYKVGGEPLTDRDNQYYLLNPVNRLWRYEEDLRLGSSMGSGIALEQFGKMMYENFDKKNRFTRNGFKQTQLEYIKRAREAEVPLAVDGFSPYLMSGASRVFNLPETGSGLFALTKSVPFVQMVLHGSVNYSPLLPGNLSSDLDEQVLLWAEYGYMPYFMLSEKGGDNLLDSQYATLFSSRFDYWKDRVVEKSLEYQKKLSALQGRYILSHQKENGLAKTVYEKGGTVYVNYNDEDVTVDGITVPARAYTVDDRGAADR